jgi:5'-deoxynucleotidase YfbR-like HD superfamily hydrolase
MIDTTERKGDWFVTYTGRRFYPLDPRVEDIDLADIAHALALQTRWNGHCKRFYSIASHSLACAAVAHRLYGVISRSETHRHIFRWALMHDAAEAYTGDIIRPIKHSLWMVRPGEDLRTAPSFKQVEAELLMLIAKRFKLPWPMHDEVKNIDNRMLVTEAKALTNYWGEKYKGGQEHWVYEKPWNAIEPYEEDALLFLGPDEAEQRFLRQAQEFGIR